MKSNVLAITLVVVMGMFVGCSNATKNGNKEDEAQKVQALAVENVLVQADSIVGDTITVNGVIANICQCEKSEGKVACLKDGEKCLCLVATEPLDTALVNQNVSVKGVLKVCEKAECEKKCEGEKKCDAKKKACCDKKKGDEKSCCEKKCEEGKKLYLEVIEIAILPAETETTETPAE